MEKTGNYTLLHREENDNFSDDDSVHAVEHSKYRPRWITRLLLASNAVSLCIIIVLSMSIWRPGWISSTLNYELKQISYYTPLLDVIKIPLETVEHDNTLFAHSQYAQPPSPEVDEAWGNLAHPRMLLVDDTTIRRIGKDPELTVQHPKMAGKHITYLALHHQLHCLNDIRKNVFSDHYYPNKTLSGTHLDHVQHCIDLLRQTIMCNANLDLITYNWWELTSIPQPDFHVNMKCRSWDAIDQYLDRPFEETGIFKWYEEGWMEGWQRQGGEKNVTIDKQWWDVALAAGNVTPDEYDARWSGP